MATTAINISLRAVVCLLLTSFLLISLAHTVGPAAEEETTCSETSMSFPITVTLYPNGGGSGQNVTLTHKELGNMGVNFYNAMGLKQDLSKVGNHTSLYRAPTRKGTHFVWPTLPIGSKIETDLVSPSGNAIELEVLSHSPRIFYVHNFMSEDETNELIAFSTDEKNPYKMARSTGGTHKSWENGAKTDILSTRTSMNAFDIQTATSKAIKRRAFDLLRIPKYKESMADGIQILRYEMTQAYISHHDFFPKKQSTDFNWDPSVGGSNRFATVFLYLSDVEFGGQTCFPLASKLDDSKHAELVERLGGEQPTKQQIDDIIKEAGIEEGSWEERLTRDCYNKFSIPPKKGDAVLFYSQTPEGSLDQSSLHGAGPVLKGTKWGANVWVWNACRYSQCKDGLHPAEEQDFEY